MKKLNLLLIAIILLLLSSGNAFALSFHWDVSTTGNTASGVPALSSGGTGVDFPLDMTTSGSSTITQTLTGGADDTVLDNGDTFTEFGGLNILSSGGWPADLPFLLDGGLTNAYIHYTGLSGTVFGHSDGGTPTTGAATITDDTYGLNFAMGVGTIKIYLDDDFDPTNAGATTEVAELSLLAGIGTQPQFILGQPEGQFGIVAEFVSVLDDFWYTQLFGDPASEDFFDIIADPNRDIIAASFNLGATLVPGSLTDTVGGDIEFDVLNEGSFVIAVVPEPTTMLLFGFGLLGIAGVTRKKTA